MFVVIIALSLTACSGGYGPSASNKDAISASGSSAVTEQQTPTTPEGAPAQPKKPSTMSMVISYGLPILLLVGMYFLLIAPQRKKEKKAKAMRDELKIGDEIVTIGGIIGKVVMIKDQDQIVIETGADKDKIRIMRWAIQQTLTISE